MYCITYNTSTLRSRKLTCFSVTGGKAPRVVVDVSDGIVGAAEDVTSGVLDGVDDNIDGAVVGGDVANVGSDGVVVVVDVLENGGSVITDV